MRLALEPDILVVGEANNGEEALALAQTCSPDVVLMDVEMPKMDGITATQALHTLAPSSAVVVMSIHDDAATQTRAQAAGAFAFISKSGAIESLLSAILQAARHIS
jgi:DNA-binding NarL/FixJ family response regulator